MAKNSSEETVIAQGVVLEGDFASEGDVYVEGEIKGHVRTAGDLRLGGHSRVKADVSANNAVVSGVVEGQIMVQNRLDILETATILGDVTCNVLTVAAGAKIQGQILMNGTGKTVQEE